MFFLLFPLFFRVPSVTNQVYSPLSCVSVDFFRFITHTVNIDSSIHIHRKDNLYANYWKRSHYKLLKRISRRTTISAESLSEEELDICSYLHSLKLIECDMQNPIVRENAYGFQSLVTNMLNIRLHNPERLKFTILNLLSISGGFLSYSIIALIVSIAAVLVQVLIR